jgi:hypothetical protein
MELMGTMDLPLHHLSRSMRPKTRRSRLLLRSMRVVHLSIVAHRRHHLPSPKFLTHLTDTVLHHHRSRKATTLTTDMAHTNITDVLAAVAAADVEVHGAVAAGLDLPPVLPLSCKT